MKRKGRNPPESSSRTKFDSEAEEASWWASHQSYIADEFERAAKQGTLGRSSIAPKLAAPPRVNGLSSK